MEETDDRCHQPGKLASVEFDINKIGDALLNFYVQGVFRVINSRFMHN